MGRFGSRIVGVLVGLAMIASASACAPDGPSGVAAVGAQCTSPPQIVAGASLFGCDLAGLDLHGAVLTGADLRGALLGGANLAGADLRNANLTGADLSGADLTGADLAGAVLAGALLLGSILALANLTGASFDFGTVFGFGAGDPAPPACGAYCPGYNEATVDTGREICDEGYGARFGIPDFYLTRSSSTLATEGRRSVVTDAATDFRGATFGGPGNLLSSLALRGLSLAEADFSDATFDGQVLGCRDVSGGRFERAHLTGVQLIDVDATGADFGAALFDGGSKLCALDLTNADLDGARFWGGTGISCTDLGDDLRSALPALVVFDAASMLGVQFGEPDGTGQRVIWRNLSSTVPTPGVSADLAALSGSAANADFSGAVFGSTTIGPFAVLGSGQWDDIDFRTSDWTGAEFHGTQSFVGSTCPDGSTGDATTPCFPLLP